MKFNQNPYYSPELCGLEIFDSIDTAGSYEFDMFVIWKKLDDGTLWWDTDSGCSCPSPFADHGHDLKLINDDLFYNFQEALKNHSNLSIGDYLKMEQKVKEYLRDYVPPAIIIKDNTNKFSIDLEFIVDKMYDLTLIANREETRVINEAITLLETIK